MTPMMQQYREAKDRHPGMLLLFRMGDFYELFDSDAETAARLLGLTLTSRDKTVSMAGFPHHSLEGYLRKLLQAGHRVAVCDQVEDPALAKGLVRREVTRVVTPGTLTEDDLLDPNRSNYLAALVPGGPRGAVGCAWADPSTGHFHAADLPRDRLDDEPARHLFLDEVTRRGLELTRTLRDGGRSGSLLSVLDRTVTPMGARMLHDWVLAPLAERRGIEERLDAVGELLEEHGLRQELRA